MQPIAAQTSQGLSVEVVWLSLLHSVWIGLAAAASVALVLQGRRTLSHRVRHAILLASLALAACGPPTLAVAQHLAASWTSAAPSTRTARAVVLPGPLENPPGVSRLAGRRAPADGSATARVLRALAVPIARLAVCMRDARPLLLTAWSLVVLGLVAVLTLGAGRASRLRREGQAAPTTVQERARRLGRRLRLRNVPAVRLHPRLSQPCLCGAIRPLILLPDRWVETVGSGPLDAVLAHELAHARRLDHLVNLGQRFVEAIYFFHPAVHWLSTSFRRHREHCADELAVRITGDPLALARGLECLAGLHVKLPRPRPIGAALGGETLSLLPPYSGADRHDACSHTTPGLALRHASRRPLRPGGPLRRLGPGPAQLVRGRCPIRGPGIARPRSRRPPPRRSLPHPIPRPRRVLTRIGSTPSRCAVSTSKRKAGAIASVGGSNLSGRRPMPAGGSSTAIR